jgi:saccharopine dehydrogenase-like NADP-dependent oxidoreductase
MKHILLFGAGKSATCLIDYLVQLVTDNNWQLTVADGDRKLAESKTRNTPGTSVAVFNIEKEAEQRQQLVASADLVISLLPPHLHQLIALDCIEKGKHLLTASYASTAMLELDAAAKEKGLLFLCEMGLDPGIDHMSAMQLINDIKSKGGVISSFKSHCGGLVAPESDDNPWHYKISWNPRNVVLAGKAGAVFKENGAEKEIGYDSLFKYDGGAEVPGIGWLACYPNRDSLGYIPVYRLEEAATFIRTTLRHPDFMYGWQNIQELRLTDENGEYDTDGKTLQDFFSTYFKENGFNDWLKQKLDERLKQTHELLEHLTKLTELESNVTAQGDDIPEAFMAVDEQGELQSVDLDNVKTNAAALVAHKMHEVNLTLKQLFFLGMDDDVTLINKGKCSPADVLQFALEQKLKLQPEDKDMIVMLHEIEYTLPGSDQKQYVSSSLVVTGEDALRTAMAKTVGLPLGIAAKLVLTGVINKTGVHIPVTGDIYEPVLKELAGLGVVFKELQRSM